MTVRHEAPPDTERPSSGSTTPGWLRAIQWLLGIFGGIAAFMGVFILFAGDDQYLGFGGYTWRVGDIAPGWGYGLIIGGGLVVLLVLASVLSRRTRRM